jgi:hypothetical protein
MSDEEPKHFRFREQLLQAEALELDGLAQEDGEVPVQRDVEGGLVRMRLKDVRVSLK